MLFEIFPLPLYPNCIGSKMDSRNVGSKNRLYYEVEDDFKDYLLSPQSGVNEGSKMSYVSSMRFLAKHYLITTDITSEDIDIIIESEKERRLTRDKYSSPRAVKCFRSALMKFKVFVQSALFVSHDDERLD